MSEQAPTTTHHYLSTACHHDLHPDCRLRCKFCLADCLCLCHRRPAAAGE